MGVLRDRMVREMPLREFSASTPKLYLATLTDLAKYHHRLPDILDQSAGPAGPSQRNITPAIRHRQRPLRTVPRAGAGLIVAAVPELSTTFMRHSR
jgi:hypothetical protein